MIMFRLSFLVRRLLIVCALLMTNHLYLQLCIAFVQEIGVLIVVGWMNPYASRGKWRRELLNESFITLTIYHVLCFSDHNGVEMRT